LSNPTPFRGSETKPIDDGSETNSLVDRMATYKSNEENGRLMSLDYKLGAPRYTPVASCGPILEASFGTKVEKSKVESIEAATRNFASQN